MEKTPGEIDVLLRHTHDSADTIQHGFAGELMTSVAKDFIGSALYSRALNDDLHTVRPAYSRHSPDADMN